MLSNIFDNPLVFSLFRQVVHNSFRGRLKLLNSLNMTGKEKVVDICCGTGHFSQFLPRDYIGVDDNSNYINYAKEKYKKEFILHDATNLSQFSDKCFDIAFVIDCLHHFPDELAENVIKEACRIARRVVIIDLITQSSFNLPAKILEILDRGKYVRGRKAELDLISNFISVQKEEVFNSGIYKELFIMGEPNNG